MFKLQVVIVVICIFIFIPYCGNSENCEVINLELINPIYTRLFYLPSSKEALFRLNNTDENSYGITTAHLSLDQYNEGWEVSKIFYSMEENQLVISYAFVYGDETGIYGRGILFPYLNFEKFLHNLELSFTSMKMTKNWEKKNGPYFLWDLETKYAYYSKYGFVPCTDYTDVWPKWGKPTSKNISIEQARSSITQLIMQQYEINDIKDLPVYEDIRYLVSDNENDGYWIFNYWIQVQQGSETYWAIVFSLRQLYDNVFAFTEAIDPAYLPCLLKDADMIGSD